MDWLRDAGAELWMSACAYQILCRPITLLHRPGLLNLARYDGVRYGARKMGDDIDDMYARTRGAGFWDEVQRFVALMRCQAIMMRIISSLAVRRLIARISKMPIRITICC